MPTPPDRMLRLADHEAAIRDLNGGKCIADAIYMHVSLAERQTVSVRKFIADAVSVASVAHDAFNVVRISKSRAVVALLSYPDFFSKAFPSLQFSWLVDLATEKVSHGNFATQVNPPILHRKELLIPEDHPSFTTFSMLTEALEDYGAFDAAIRLIGRQAYWAATLLRLGLSVDGHELSVVGGTSSPDLDGGRRVARHRTAISRSHLSVPMRTLERWGFLDQNATVLDYGCGRGDDVRRLCAAGIAATGWDPHYAPDVPREPADIVNLGFVLNVVENPAERQEALKEAFRLTRRVLSVAVMTESNSGRIGYGDGVLTSRNTFQRGFTQLELQSFVIQALGREPISVGQGIVFVFRDDEEEQAFLVRRQQSSPTEMASVDEMLVCGAKPTKSLLYEKHQGLLDAYWCAALELGRLPEPDECAAARDVAASIGSTRRAYAAIPFIDKTDLLERAGVRRTNDLIVYLALNLFERRRSVDTISHAMKRDLRHFFGGHRRALERAREMLLGVSRAEILSDVATRAHAAGLGVLADADGDYTFRASMLQVQPPEIRIVLGCAEQLEAIPPNVHLLKVHGEGHRVSYLSFDNFDGRQLPTLVSRTMIDLRRQRVVERTFRALEDRRVLLGKAQFMRAEDPARPRQEEFDGLLRARGLLSRSGLGPSVQTFAQQLRDAGIGTHAHRSLPTASSDGQTSLPVQE